MSFSATDAAFEGFRVVRRQPLTIVWWTLAYLVCTLAFFAVGAPAVANLMSMAETLEGSTQPSIEEFQQIAMVYAAFLGWVMPLALICGAIINAAVARSVLRPAESAFGYLRLGMDEVRVLVVTVVLGILAMIVSVVVWGLVGVLAGFVGASGQNALWLVVVVAGLGAVALLIWLAVRFSLAIPITVAERRIAIFDSFGVTRGRFWGILGMAVIAFVMTMIVALLGMVVGMPVTLATGGLSALAELQEASIAEIFRVAGVAIIAWTVVNAILSALQIAVMYAPFSAAYRDIKGATAE